MTQIIEPELSYKIGGACFKTHNKLGRFCSERQYADELENKLQLVPLPYLREYELAHLPHVDVKGNRVDFLIAQKIILDVKAKKFIAKDDYHQMLRYLEAANLQLGLIVNFRATYVKPKRVVNNRYRL